MQRFLLSFFAATLLAGTFVVLLSRGSFLSAAPFTFDVALSSSVNGTAQLFYDIGQGIREEDSVHMSVRKSDSPQIYRFPLPRGDYRSLRFDPLDRAGSITISEAKIVDRNTTMLKRFPPTQLVALHQIQTLNIEDETAYVETSPGASDPMLRIAFDPPLVLGSQVHTGVLRRLTRQFLLPFFLSWAGLWFADGFLLRYQSQVALWCQRRTLWAYQHPSRMIIGGAVCGVIISCYPVIFYGKSFVSPNNGVYLLYERFPTLPGYDDTTVEDAKGADVGAVMVAHLPYSVVESRALFHDGELPLWNRYNSNGETLLGQGQSMLGDPLHLPVLFAGGASWAWDVKYVLAKILFACGLGFTVYAITGHLPASLIIGCSSAFIGFFSFRFNHPAIFSLSYAPWILYCWVKFSRTTSAAVSALWTGGLIGANWLELTSGTVKEAYVLLLSMNGGGLLVMLLAEEAWRSKLRKLWQILGAGGLFVVISAPLWFTFLHTLGQAFSLANEKSASQVQPGLLLGLFDEMFYRQLTETQKVFLPSVNFLVLFGVLWSVARLRELLFNRIYLAVSLSSLLPLFLVFGVVPSRLITHVPFLANITHIHNVFSCVLVIHLTVLAGFGVQRCWDQRKEKEWPVDLMIVVLLLSGLLALYFGTTKLLDSRPFTPETLFFYAYTLLLIGATVAWPLLLRWVTTAQVTTLSPVFLLLGVLGLMLWRHGMYLPTSVDPYLMNPQVRVDLQGKSPAIEFMRTDTPQPFRAVGFGNNLFPGYTPVLGVEGPHGVDAILNPYFRELVKALPVELIANWRLVVQPAMLSQLQRVYDFLNVKYYLALSTESPRDLSGLRLAGKFDLDVYVSDSVWPRAFFTDSLLVYDSASAMVDLLQAGDGKPFAAVRTADLQNDTGLAPFVKDPMLRHTVFATDYRLTTNTTTFTIDAPSAGIVVLTEAYLTGDFHVTVNGKTAPYFRCNQAFKGILLEQPGRYTVTFAYWPQYFTLSLWSWGVGTVMLIVWLGRAWRA